jgi:hypothetical protein
MNKLLMILMVLVLCNTYAQKRKMSFERLKALKMSYITEKIGLSQEEESTFWEIFDQYESKIYEESRKKIKTLRRSYIKNADSISNKEAFELIKKINELEHLAIQLEEERDELLLEKFSPNKILKMHSAEFHFNRDMIYKMKNMPPKKEE